MLTISGDAQKSSSVIIGLSIILSLHEEKMVNITSVDFFSSFFPMEGKPRECVNWPGAKVVLKMFPNSFLGAHP